MSVIQIRLSLTQTLCFSLCFPNKLTFEPLGLYFLKVGAERFLRNHLMQQETINIAITSTLKSLYEMYCPNLISIKILNLDFADSPLMAKSLFQPKGGSSLSVWGQPPPPRPFFFFLPCPVYRAWYACLSGQHIPKEKSLLVVHLALIDCFSFGGQPCMLIWPDAP